jgi:hypothetical protein
MDYNRQHFAANVPASPDCPAARGKTCPSIGTLLGGSQFHGVSFSNGKAQPAAELMSVAASDLPMSPEHSF